MKALERKIGTSVLANVLTLLFGTALAQVVSLSVSPLLTRLYEPEDFGQLALFTSITGIITVVSTARLEIAIVLPKSESEATVLFRLALMFSLIVSFITGIVLALFYFTGFAFAKKLGLTNICLAPVYIFCSAGIQTFYYYFLRKKDFFGNSLGRILLAISTALVNIILGTLLFGAKGLVFGTVAGAGMALTYYFIRGKKSIATDAGLANTNKVSSISVIAKYKDFIMINTPHVLLDTFFDLGLVFALNYYYGDKIVGFYAFSYRILKAPVNMVGSAMFQVLYQNMVQKNNEGESLLPVVSRTYRQLFWIGVPAFALLFIFSPFLFAFVFGQKWYEAGLISQILVPWIFINFIASPVSSIVLILKRQKTAFLITVIDLSLRTAAVIYGGIVNDYKLSFILMSIIGCCTMTFAVIWYYTLAQKTHKYAEAKE